VLVKEASERASRILEQKR